MGLFYDHIALAVTDIDRSIAFYQGVMGLKGGKRHFQKDGREQATLAWAKASWSSFTCPDTSRRSDLLARACTIWLLVLIRKTTMPS